MQKHAGFTLLEVLVVTVSLAVLVSIAYFVWGK